MGDFNTDLGFPFKKDAVEILSMMAALGLYPSIAILRHVTQTSHTIFFVQVS